MHKSIKILEEDYKKVNEYAIKHDKTLSDALHELLNNQHETIQQSEPTPKITKCVWDYYYWRPQKNEYGKVIEWEKINECPILNSFPDLLTLPPKQRVDALMKACNTCMLKEKSIKQKERKKTKSKISHDGIEPYPIPEEFSPYRHVF